MHMRQVWEKEIYDSHGRIGYREFISYPSTAYAGNNTLCEINSYTSAEIH